MKYLKSFKIFESVDTQGLDTCEEHLIKISDFFNMCDNVKDFKENKLFNPIYRLFNRLYELINSVSVIDKNGDELLSTLSEIDSVYEKCSPRIMGILGGVLKFDPVLYSNNIKEIYEFLNMIKEGGYTFKSLDSRVSNLVVFESEYYRFLSDLNTVYNTLNSLNPFKFDIEEIEDLFIDDIDDKKMKLNGYLFYSKPYNVKIDDSNVIFSNNTLPNILTNCYYNRISCYGLKNMEDLKSMYRRIKTRIETRFIIVSFARNSHMDGTALTWGHVAGGDYEGVDEFQIIMIEK